MGNGRRIAEKVLSRNAVVERLERCLASDVETVGSGATVFKIAKSLGLGFAPQTSNSVRRLRTKVAGGSDRLGLASEAALHGCRRQ